MTAAEARAAFFSTVRRVAFERIGAFLPCGDCGVLFCGKAIPKTINCLAKGMTHPAATLDGDDFSRNGGYRCNCAKSLANPVKTGTIGVVDTFDCAPQQPAAIEPGPMPGTLIRRSHSASHLASSSISLDKPSMRLSSRCQSEASPSYTPHAGESTSGGVARMRGSSARRKRCPSYAGDWVVRSGGVMTGILMTSMPFCAVTDAGRSSASRKSGAGSPQPRAAAPPWRA